MYALPLDCGRVFFIIPVAGYFEADSDIELSLAFF
jgi:hypothetical protein